MCRYATLVLAIVLLVALVAAFPAQAETTIRIGYFEAGEHPLNYLLREEIQRQIANMAPPDTQFVFVPEGYRSASWIRDSSRIMAAELVKARGVDIMVAVGPWVVQDLLAAGYSGPIVGVRQIDLLATGLVNSVGTPAARNLTVHEMPGKIEDDINVFARLVPIKKLGVLWFDGGDTEQDSVVARITRLGRQLGFETVTAEGFNIHGTYAFFKSFQSLPKDIDGLYLGPAWSMTVVEINELLRVITNEGIPVFTWEGKFMVSRGAFATNYAYGLVSEAHFQVLKLLRIARGETPADLPVLYRGSTSLAVNTTTAALVGADVPAEALLSGEPVTSAEPEQGDRYSLADAVGRAINGNPSYLATYDAIEAATRAAREIGAQYWPHVAIEGRAGYVDDHTLNNTVEPLKNDQYRASLVLEQTLLSLESLRSRKVAAAQMQLSEAAQRQARLDLELAVATAYLARVRAAEELKVEQRYRELVERTLEYVASDYYLRQEGEADLLRWQDERQQVITRVLGADNAALTARVLLNLLFNLPPEQRVTIDSGVASIRLMGLNYEMLAGLAVKPEARQKFESYLIGQARQGSAAMAAEDARLGIERARLHTSSARRWPSLDLRAALNLVDEIDDGLEVIDEETGTWSVFGRLRFPLFMGGKHGHEQARLKAQVSEQEYYRDAALLGLYGDIRRETGRLVTQVASWPRHSRSAELALQGMRLVIDEYEAGKRDMTALIEAYDHAREAELAEIASRYEFMATMARLVHDLGWSPSVNFRSFHDEFLTRVREPLGR